MYEYVALTKFSTVLPHIIRIDKNHVITKYDVKTKTWKNAPDNISGIYTGDIECEKISESEANKIIEKWRTFHD